MQEPLASKVGIVSGAGRGLGRAMALGLARAGARVIALTARERGEVEALARRSQNIVPLLADVSREEDCARAVAEATTRFGDCPGDRLGTARAERRQEGPPDDAQLLAEARSGTTAKTCRCAAPRLEAQRAYPGVEGRAQCRAQTPGERRRSRKARWPSDYICS